MAKRLLCLLSLLWYLLPAGTTFAFTHADTLRGSNGHGRDWWKVHHYDLKVAFNMGSSFHELAKDLNIQQPDTAYKAINGQNTVTVLLTGMPRDSMQIDLQEPMSLSNAAILQAGQRSELDFTREGNVYWLKFPANQYKIGDQLEIVLDYQGIPREAVNPPWDGGFSWKKDSVGHPWVAVSCQGLGASVWWPCKDAQWEEPDSGMDMLYSVPYDLVAVGNGIRQSATGLPDLKETRWYWHVKNPINNYDVSFYIGDYVHWDDTIVGEKGTLQLDFWVLRHHLQQAKTHFAIVKQMLHCFEYWMGPYPFYEDGYKLVEAPYLGMEHQSAVAYGNEYKMGYRGFDRTGTGIGMNFDYIIVHETGHEWFGNSITAKDMADNWIHEGITTYSETLFAECLLGKIDADTYCRGEWRNIQNDKPIIGPYGVNEEGSNDMYDKGTAIMHMIRTLTNDDEKFRQMLRGLSQTFYHKTITTAEVEQYVAAHTGLALDTFFNQYLRSKSVPRLEYYIKKKHLYYRFTDIVPGFTLPLTATAGSSSAAIKPTADWQQIRWKRGYNVRFSKDFLIEVK